MLEISTEPNGSTLRIKLEGYINEFSDFSQIDPGGFDTLEVDFAEVNMINSTGIAKWVKWCKQLDVLSLNFVFTNCTKVIVNQINSVHGFAPAGTIILSLFVPYYNEDTDTAKDILIFRGQHYQESTGNESRWVRLPEEPEYEPDILHDRYFNFLK